MEAKRHPDFPEEKGYHEQARGFIDRCISGLTTRFTDEGDLIRCVPTDRGQQRLLEGYRVARREPYFGRVDRITQSGTTDTLYIGKEYLNVPGVVKVFSWAEGTATADLWYTNETSYEQGKLQRKRLFAFAQSELSEISDLFVAEGLQRSAALEFADDVLRQLLEKHRGDKLGDIVATIQQRQYEIIKAPKDQVLIIQGAPGSGKTSIALHRVAYLLYHHRDELSNVLVLGPSRVFLSFASGILPALGEHGIAQRPFDEWLAAQIGEQVAYESQDASLERLIDPGADHADRALEYRVGRMKGSLAMAALLDRYVERLYQLSLDELVDLEVAFEEPVPGRPRHTARRTATQIRELLAANVALPPARQAEVVQAQLLRELRRELRDQLTRLDERKTLDDIYKPIEDSIAPQLAAYFGGWMGRGPRAFYRALLRDTALLGELGRSSFDPWAQEMLALSARPAQGALPFADLAPVAYLKLRLEGPATKPYDHIVVDEAQDLAPLHFRLLVAHQQRPSMTLLGDLAQGIYAQSGITAWEDLVQALEPLPIKRYHIPESYRSTQEIISFANAMLTRIGADKSLLAEPFARKGPTPEVRPLASRRDLLTNVQALLREEHGRGRKSLALICKTAAGCRQLAGELRAASVTGVQLITSRDTEYQGGTVILPAYLTKGMEFDTVLIADADGASYGGGELDVRLLFVAMTRAAHRLVLCYIGALAPALSGQGLRGMELLATHYALKPITIEQFVSSEDAYKADWCVERLAGTGRLRLLTTGMCDAALLKVLMASLQRPAKREKADSPRQPVETSEPAEVQR